MVVCHSPSTKLPPPPPPPKLWPSTSCCLGKVASTERRLLCIYCAKKILLICISLPRDGHHIEISWHLVYVVHAGIRLDLVSFSDTRSKFLCRTQNKICCLCCLVFAPRFLRKTHCMYNVQLIQLNTTGCTWDNVQNRYSNKTRLMLSIFQHFSHLINYFNKFTGTLWNDSKRKFLHNSTTVVPLLVATLNRSHHSNKAIDLFCYQCIYFFLSPQASTLLMYW